MPMFLGLAVMTTQRVGLLFGGKSGEHEVSIVSAQAIAAAFQIGENPNKYELIPFYIDKAGIWHDPPTRELNSLSAFTASAVLLQLILLSRFISCKSLSRHSTPTAP